MTYSYNLFRTQEFYPLDWLWYNQSPSLEGYSWGSTLGGSW